MKQRAPRNRTLTLSDADRLRLAPQLAAAPGVDSIICGDLLDVVDSIADASMNLIIIDPPYNLTKDFGSRRFGAMTDGAYERYLDSWFGRVADKLRPDGSLYMCGDWRSSAAMQRVISRRLTLLNRITWQREKGRGAAANWKNSMEDIWFAVANPRRYFFNADAVKIKRRVLAPYRSASGRPKDWVESPDGNYRMTCPSNFWDDITVPFWSMPENTDHPTQKPEKLIAKLILASSRPGDMVFDPFAGSGTTAVTARKLGRRFICVEREREYCLTALRRLEMAAADPSIQGYTDGLFLDRNFR